MDSEKTLTLAPASGAGIGKLVASELLADPDFIPAMKEAAMGGLRAETSRWDRDAKCFVTEPDAKTRITAWLGILAHMEGDPIKRVLHVHSGAGKALDPVSALQSDPTLLAAAERVVANARHRENKPARREKRADPVDGEVSFDA